MCYAFRTPFLHSVEKKPYAPDFPFLPSPLPPPRRGRRTLSTSALRARDTEPPAACEFADTVAQDGTRMIEFTRAGQRTLFVAQRQRPWWSGTLDGQAAMGYELNRSQLVIATRDLQTTFEWWSRAAAPARYTNAETSTATTREPAAPLNDSVCGSGQT